MEEKILTTDLFKADDPRTFSLILNKTAKVCKIILRKLSVTHDTGFRGKVQKLIA